MAVSFSTVTRNICHLKNKIKANLEADNLVENVNNMVYFISRLNIVEEKCMVFSKLKKDSSYKFTLKVI